jgi:transposase
MARPTKLNDELTRQIARMIRAGNSVEVLCDVVGIGESTFYDWLERGKSDARNDALYRRFRAAVLKAHGDRERKLVGYIERAARNGSWKAAEWLMKRQEPEQEAAKGASEPAPDAPRDLPGNVTPLRSAHGGF